MTGSAAVAQQARVGITKKYVVAETAAPGRDLFAIAWMLERVGVRAKVAAAEIAATEPLAIGRTESRVVLGLMNVMTDEAHHDLTDPERVPDLRATSLYLADSIYGQLGQDEGSTGHRSRRRCVL